MDKLSVVIITLNEERNIRRALESVVPFADEIIVLDSFSTDKTKSICEEFNVKLIEREWEGYAGTKNYANAQAAHDWIFSIDADEAADEQMQKAIIDLKAKGFDGVYTVNRLTNYCGKWIKYSTWYPDWKPRIFKKDTAEWVGRYVHEELNFSEKEKINRIPGHMHHYSYYDYAEHRARADKYSKLTAKKLHALGKKASLLRLYTAGFGRFMTMFVLNLGILDGWKGFKIAQISAQSNVVKYRELRKLNKNNG